MVAVAKAKSFPTDIPLAPNVREPNPGSDLFRSIVNTLLLSPDKFVERNNGIKIVCDSVVPLQDALGHITALRITCKPPTEHSKGQGIYNGGHTARAIQTARIRGASLEKAQVKVELLFGLSNEDIVANSLTTNTSIPVDNRSKVNALGGFDFIREYKESNDLGYKIGYYQKSWGHRP